MDLKKVDNIFEMDKGAPSPLLISNDTELILMFYSDYDTLSDYPVERKPTYDESVYLIKFNGYVRYNFGFPNDETLHGHPYSGLGLRPYSFYELKGSHKIQELKKIDKVHPYHDPSKWNDYKHYIITFHDNMFECICSGFEIEQKGFGLYEEVSSIMKKLLAR